MPARSVSLPLFKEVMVFGSGFVTLLALLRTPYVRFFFLRLWLHMLFSLRMLPTSDELLEDKFLDELELVCKKEIVCRLDPLLLLANISTKATKI